MLGKSEWTIFFMNIQTASVRTWSFVQFILPLIHLQRQESVWRGIFKKIETKRRRCADYIGSDSNVTTQVWVTFQFVITIALSVITDHLICMECLCLFYLNHISSHLWGMYAVKHTELVPIIAVGVYFWVYNLPRLFKQSVLMRGLKTGQKIAYSNLNYKQILITL